MARSQRLKSLLAQAKRTSDQAQRSLLKSEDELTVLEDRESRRADRDAATQAEVVQRFPAIGGDH
jgi:hypothetical protein